VAYAARPSSSFGYYRGNPIYGGDSGKQGPQVSGANVFSAGQGTTNNAGGSSWSPTILYLFVLIIAEMFVFAILARHI
jgi:hypothetical protein